MLRDRPIEPEGPDLGLLAGDDWDTWGDSPRPQKALNIEQDRYDTTIYDDVVDAAPAMAALTELGTATFPALLQDVWAELYKMDPRLVPKDQISPGYLANRAIIEKMIEDPATAEARLTTVLDDLGAAVATMAAGERLLAEIGNREELRQAMDKAGQADQADHEGDPDTAEALAQQAQDQLEGATRHVRQAVRAALKAGQSEARETNEALRGWGLESADLQRLPMEDRLNLARRLRRPELKRVADLVGRMKNLARARQRVKLARQRDEVHNITVGNDLQHLLPAELVQLRHPTLRLDWYRRYTEKALLQYQLRSREKVGRGPMVILLDASGSMGGDPIEWAVAVALALVDTAGRQKRWSKVIVFNYSVAYTVDFAPGERDPEKFADLASIGAGGGTNYVEPLVEALVTMQQAEYKQADLVMITDGACLLPDDFKSDLLQRKKTQQFRVWSIHIPWDGSAGDLAEWSDQVWSVRDLAAPEAAGDVFESVY